MAIYLLAYDPGVVPSSAAKQLASVDTLRCGVALSSLSAKRPGFTVGPAEVGRVLAVDEVEASWRLYGLTLGYEAVAVVPGYDLGRPVEGLLETVADLAERRHLAPAGAHRARARQPVTLAFRPHEVSDRL